jgi:hypothetical protein
MVEAVDGLHLETKAHPFGDRYGFQQRQIVDDQGRAVKVQELAELAGARRRQQQVGIGPPIGSGQPGICGRIPSSPA